MSDHDDDICTNESNNTHIGELISARLSRREVLGGGLGASAALMFGGIGLGVGLPGTAAAAAPALGFTAVAKHTNDLVTLPAGYSFRVITALGDPLTTATPAWAGDGSETAASYEQRFGDHHDAIAFYGMTNKQWDAENSDDGLLVQNHEALTTVYLHQSYDNNVAPRNGEQALKEMNAHGVSVARIRKNGFGKFYVTRGHAMNRRITAQTPASLSGAVRGTRFAVTRFDPAGVNTRGTVNNCANGVTPWGTYLACEENWAGYFGRGASDNAARPAAEVTLLNRYGITQGASGRHKWHTVTDLPDTAERFTRWNASVTGTSLDGSDDYRHEPNNFGWCVEIDPFKPASEPKKRTALGRMGHEGAWFAPAVAGQPLVAYMGDDSRGEYIYKFVSDAAWDSADVNGGLQAGNKYLNKGTLYVAKFNSDGSGAWVALKWNQNGLTSANVTYPFTSQAAVLVATRLAADSVGATKMDRPEWGGVNPLNGDVYLTLTNNSNRSGTQDAANPRAYDSDTGSYTTSLNGNVNGHIIRWQETGGDHAALSFAWDIYAFASRAAYPANVNISALDASNDHSSPDGLWFDPRGILWIQTDDGAYTSGVAGDSTATNCMMLAAVPGNVGDGAFFDVPTATGTVRTYVGAAPGSNLRRFLVGPKDCEITGVCMTPDNRTMFVNIQHPGEGGSLPPTLSNWPDVQTNPGSTARPRSSTIVITRDDGGEIGVV